jgi:DNA-binding response OmpR family regulator
VQSTPFVSDHRDVVIIRWPEGQDEVDRLEQLRVPRLLLVDPDVSPPRCASCLEDWIRLPADDADVRARIASLASRALQHPYRPTLDECGALACRGRRIFVSELDQRILTPLLARFDDVVAEGELLGAWPGHAQNNALRVHLSRLRRRLEPLGLTIIAVRNKGYTLTDFT